MVDIQSPTAEIMRRKKRKRGKIEMTAASALQGDHNKGFKLMTTSYIPYRMKLEEAQYRCPWQ